MTARSQPSSGRAPVAGRRSPRDAQIATEVRKAALLLHALHDRDRGWLLERLPDSDRSGLRSLLAELEALGIPVDRDLLDEVIRPARDAGSSPRAAVDGPESQPKAVSEDRVRDETVRSLEQAAPDRLATILRDEPAGLIAVLLAVHPWPWKDHLLKMLGPMKLRQVEGLMARRVLRSSEAPAGRVAGVAPALVERLLVTLSERLTGTEPGRATEAASSERPSRWVGAGMPSVRGRVSWLEAGLRRFLLLHRRGPA